MNKLFYEKLVKYTHYPFELIIIDNNSTDGSREFFQSKGAVVIGNAQNYSYPYCQNQGIGQAKYPVLAFLNNDIIVAPQWDKHILEAMEANGLDIITSCGIERVESVPATLTLSRRWKLIRNFIGTLAINGFTLRLMAWLMYGDWEKFCARRHARFGNQVQEGFVGNSVIMTRSGLEKVGRWDERIQAADFDLYIRSKKRHLEQGDIKPMQIALGVFNHHFIRLTVKSKPVKFADADNIIRVEEKWLPEERALYLKDYVAL